MSKIYCNHCEQAIDGNLDRCPYCALKIETEKSKKVEGRVDLISDGLGLKKIETFSWVDLFRDILTKKKPEEVEIQVSYGFPNTTPKLSADMLAMPTPWLFARMLFWSLIIFLALIIAFERYHNILIVPSLVFMGTFAAPATLLMLFYELNTPKNISLIRVIQIFILAGVISVIVALILYEITIRNKFYSEIFGGPIEELAKLLTAIFLVRSIRFNRTRFSINGLLIGASVGAGFAALESAGYALASGLFVNKDMMIANIVARGFLAPFCHTVWSAIAVCGFWRARQYNRNNFETLFDLRFIPFFVIACLLHFFWNYNYEIPYAGKYFIIGIISWAIVFRLYQDGIRQIESAVFSFEIPEIKKSTNYGFVNNRGWLISGILNDGRMLKYSISNSDRTYIVGRESTADIVIPDTSISRNHALLKVSNNKLWVSDSGSTNGTFINGYQLTQDPIEMKTSDTLKFGTIQLSLSLK